MKIKWLGHSSIKIIDNNKVIYIDPYQIEENINDADYIFITHSHYDHFSKEDINQIRKANTKIIITSDIYDQVISMNFEQNNIQVVMPNQEYQFYDFAFSTISSYNTNKKFHSKENNWVGYILNLEYKIYIAGDTDITEENKQVKCDIAFLPIGGTYTMDAIEAATLANIIKPKYVYPIHYGTIVGTNEDAIVFKNNLELSIKCFITQKNEVISLDKNDN